MAFLRKEKSSKKEKRNCYFVYFVKETSLAVVGCRVDVFFENFFLKNSNTTTERQPNGVFSFGAGAKSNIELIID